MILQLAANGPAIIRIGAEALLVLHIGGAAIGLAAGGAAMVVRKGSRPHRIIGHVFAAAMLIMSAIGAAASPYLPQHQNVVPGLFTFYLVATGWMAAHRTDGPTGFAEYAALLFAVATVAIGVSLGLRAAHAPDGLLDATPATFYYIVAGLPALSALADIHILLRGELAGPRRIRRHIWRTSCGLLVAVISFFIGKQDSFPNWLHGSPLLLIPELAVVGTMTYWLVRTRAPRRCAITLQERFE